MPQVTPLSPELLRSVSALARALGAAGRSRGEFPHAVVEAVDPERVNIDPLAFM